MAMLKLKCFICSVVCGSSWLLLRNMTSQKSRLIKEDGTRKLFMKDILQLLCIYGTLTSTSCPAERSFSALRRVKNYLGSTMSQDRLSHVCLLHAHKQLMGELLDKIGLLESNRQLWNASNNWTHSF